MKKIVKLCHDREKEFLSASKRLDSFMDEFDKDFPSISLLMVVADKEEIYTRRTETDDMLRLIGHLEVLKSDMLASWPKR